MKKILVVDDNKNVADLAEIILTSAGYVCTKTNNGKSCLDAVRASYQNDDGYDLILLDVAMPGFSGVDVLNALKQEGSLERVNVAFFTASSATSLDIADYEKMGARGCLRKPFTKAELLNFVGKHTSG
ncbi:MAG: response regulator [Nitrososphaera sp.]|uniref:response regulator n=1 Tax=Nitrososphaera sp. TaxID=1971748 RepID=UPI001795E40C|nr:response regulator [Nitrososphaera sp.]NWG37709.1 response regulator [Nitrososphaera sp.]